MKLPLSLLLVFVFSSAFSQARAPKMAPIFADGYYVTHRKDTVRGEVQVNVEDETSIYNEFAFRKKGSSKPRKVGPNVARAYGFTDRNFVLVSSDGKKFFAERLVFGRLAFYECMYHGKIDGLPAIESAYFIRDTWKPVDAKAKEIPVTVLHEKFYKKSLKPFMQDDQPMIWSDLDKFTFEKNKVVNAINEFNSYYEDSAN